MLRTKPGQLVCILGLMGLSACPAPKPIQIQSDPLAPCISIPYKKWQDCACHPNVQAAVDILGPQITENSRREIEKCLSGSVEVNASIQGKKLAEIEGKLAGCIKTKIQLDDTLSKAITSIAIALAASTPLPRHIEAWTDCMYPGRAKP